MKKLMEHNQDAQDPCDAFLERKGYNKLEAVVVELI